MLVCARRLTPFQPQFNVLLSGTARQRLVCKERKQIVTPLCLCTEPWEGNGIVFNP